MSKKLNIVYRKHRIVWSNTKNVYHIKNMDNVPLSFATKISVAKKYVDDILDSK